MKSLDDYLKKHDIKALAKHPRLKMLDEFHRRINAERKAADMRPFPVKVIAIKTAHLSVDDMAYLLKRCSQSANFSKCFFGSLKVKNPGETKNKNEK